MGEIIEFPFKGDKPSELSYQDVEELDFDEHLVEVWQCTCGSVNFRWEAWRGLVCTECNSWQEGFELER